MRVTRETDSRWLWWNRVGADQRKAKPRQDIDKDNGDATVPGMWSKGRSEMNKECAAIDCEDLVDRRMLMCRPHWYTIPKALRNRIWRGVRRSFDEDYWKARDEAIEWVAVHGV